MFQRSGRTASSPSFAGPPTTRHDRFAHRHRAHGRGPCVPIRRAALRAALAVKSFKDRRLAEGRACNCHVIRCEAPGSIPSATPRRDHWRHIIASSPPYEPRAYTREQHQAWLKRRSRDDPLCLRHRERRISINGMASPSFLRPDAAAFVWNASAQRADRPLRPSDRPLLAKGRSGRRHAGRTAAGWSYLARGGIRARRAAAAKLMLRRAFRDGSFAADRQCRSSMPCRSAGAHDRD